MKPESFGDVIANGDFGDGAKQREAFGDVYPDSLDEQ